MNRHPSDAFKPLLDSVLSPGGLTVCFVNLVLLGLQSWLARHLKLRGGRYWIAVGISASLWTLAHALSLEPMWVKFAQILPFGLALGWLFRRYGLEICVFAHAAFNIVLIHLPLRIAT